MRDTISNLAYIPTNAWVFSYLVADFRHEWHKDNSAAARLNHWVCYPAIVGWLVSYVAAPPPLVLAVLQLPFPILWWYIHKHYHNHKNKRRLLEAGRGLVQRFHNRLVVVPEPSS